MHPETQFQLIRLHLDDLHEASRRERLAGSARARAETGGASMTTDRGGSHGHRPFLAAILRRLGPTPAR